MDYQTKFKNLKERILEHVDPNTELGNSVITAKNYLDIGDYERFEIRTQTLPVDVQRELYQLAFYKAVSESTRRRTLG